MTSRRLFFFLLLPGLLCAGTLPGQVIRVKKGRLRAQLSPDSMALTASPASLTFSVPGNGVGYASGPVNITLSYNFTTNRIYGLYAYFSSTTALTDGASPAHIITTAMFFGQCSTGSPTSYAPFTTSGYYSANSLWVYQSAAQTGTGSRTDALNLAISLNGSNVPAGNYTGTMVLQAYAF